MAFRKGTGWFTITTVVAHYQDGRIGTAPEKNGIIKKTQLIFHKRETIIEIVKLHIEYSQSVGTNRIAPAASTE